MVLHHSPNLHVIFNFHETNLTFPKIVRCVVKIDANIGMKPEKAKLFIIFFAFVMDCDRPFWFMAKYSTLFPYLLYMRQKAEKTFKFKYIHIELSKSFCFKWFTFHIYPSILYSSEFKSTFYKCNHKGVHKSKSCILWCL